MPRLVAAATFVIVLAAVLVPAAPAAASLPKPDPDAPATVLISEVRNGDPGTASDSFVELVNTGDTAVDLSGWALYRCSIIGLRRNVGHHEADLSGRVLAPGGFLTISRIGMPGDLHISSGYPTAGFGLFLEDPEGRPADMVGVYPNRPWPTRSECTPDGGNLPNALIEADGESWQRVSTTGDPVRDWIAAPATPGAPNATAAPVESDAAVVIAEVAAAGPAGSGDELLELRNDADHTVDMGGWTIWRCTRTGRLTGDTLQLTVPEGTRLASGALWVVGGSTTPGEPDARWSTGLADREFGVLVRDREGAIVDRVAVSAYGDSACQDPKLPATLDAIAGESSQRTASGWVAAPRTPGRANATRDDAVFGPGFAYPESVGVAISEVATDPSTEGMPFGTVQRNFVELGNYGDRTVDISGWTAWRCMADGARAFEPQFTVPDGTSLAPGAVFVAAREGTHAAAAADARYPISLSLLGTGIWLEDERGVRVDSVGVYAQNEMDQDNVTASPCTKGTALIAYRPDRLEGETFQRSRFTGSDAADFVTARATPGTIDERTWIDPTVRVEVPVEIATRPGVDPGEPLAGSPASVLAMWAGSSAEGPLATRTGDAEAMIDPTAPLAASDDGYRFPYHRIVLDARGLEPGSLVGWSGTTEGRAEVQLSVWDGSAWRLLDAASGPEVALDGALTSDDIRGGGVELLVQAGPRTAEPFAELGTAEFEHPDDYDLAISHVTDTQYLTEAYPEVYAQELSWIAANAEARKIAFATHTGDLIQNHVDPAQNEVRAREEFETASAIQRILEQAQVPHSVLPGNHDNLRGADDSLFNEYFGPERYADAAWFGGTIAPDDGSANFSLFEQAGARFLMLSLPYAYAEREIAWAEEVVAAHPDRNVVISTHEHVTPKSDDAPATRSSGSRWVSRGDELWKRVIAPNRNVVVVVSGHFHGVGAIVTEDAGGLDGHTVVELLADYQEFRTHTGERATGYQRLLQLDLASGGIAVDTFSVRLGDDPSHEYDYQQFVPDTGSPLVGSNARPWRIVEHGLQHRYEIADDRFRVDVSFQYAKSLATDAVTVAPPGSAEPHAPTRTESERPGDEPTPQALVFGDPMF